MAGDIGPFAQLFGRTLGIGLRGERKQTDQLISQVQADNQAKALPGAVRALIKFGQQPMTMQQHEQYRAELSQQITQLHEYTAADTAFRSNAAALRKTATPTESKMLDAADRMRAMARDAANNGDLKGATALLAQAESAPAAILKQRYADNAPIRQFRNELHAAGVTNDQAAEAWDAKLGIADRKEGDNIARGILAHHLPWPSGTQTKDPTYKYAMSRVLQLDPNFQANLYDLQKNTLQAYTYGKQGDILRSVDVATGHTEMLRQAAQALGNQNSTLANQWLQAYHQQTGKTGPVTFDAIKTFVGDEVTKAVVGGQAAEKDRDRIIASIEKANSFPQLDDAINAFQHLMYQQVSGLRTQYERSGRTDWNGSSERPTPMISKATQAILSRFDPANIQQQQQQQKNADTAGSVHGTINRNGQIQEHTNRATNENKPKQDQANLGQKVLGAAMATGQTVGKGLQWLSKMVLGGLE